MLNRLTSRPSFAYSANEINSETGMPTRNVVLTDHQAALVEQREAEDAQRLEALRVAVQLGAADIAAGRFKSFDTQASLRDHLESLG
jgi:antitoxin ParD1/3/4